MFELLEKSAAKYGANVAVCCDNSEVLYKDLYRNVINIGNKLIKEGLNEYENVAIIMENSIEFIESFFAVNFCKGVVVPIYVNTGINKLIELIDFYDIEYILTTKKYKDIFDCYLLQKCRRVKKIYLLDCENIITLINNYSIDNEFNDKLKKYRKIKDIALVLLTSGTTNKSIGIMLSNKNIVSNVKAITAYLEVNHKDKILLIKNMNHASSITGEMLVSIMNGSTMVLTSKIPSPALILDLIKNKQITIFFAVPTILIGILKTKSIKSYDTDSLRIVNFYGASMSPILIEEIVNKFPKDVNFIYSYGLTEASPRVTYIYKNDLMKKKKSSGKPIKNVSILILDENDNQLSSGNVGEIAVIGPNVMQGYYKDEGLTSKTLRNGMLHTGDFGYIDNDNFLYIVGRKDNLIIKSGKNVYPEEIEEVLNSFEGVVDVLVRGEEDEVVGVRIRAYIVVDDGYFIDIKDIIRHSREFLEDYKVPNEIYFVEKLDKTASGKILRKQVLDEIVN